MKRELIEVDGKIEIPFEWRDLVGPPNKRLGRAEFMVCLKIRRGRLVEFWVDPLQTRLTQTWHCKAGEYNNFGISSYVNDEHVGAWLFHYCKEHKTLAFNVYAPDNAKYLVIHSGGLEFWPEKE